MDIQALKERLAGLERSLDRLLDTLWNGLRNRAVSGLLVCVALALGGVTLAMGWFTQPDRFSGGYAPVQPIPFSHKTHAGTMSIPCLYCHSQAKKSRHAGIPPTETCMRCHKVTKTDSEPIKLLTEVHKKGEPIRWKRVHSMPDHVYFDHRPHVRGGVACQTCHGQIETLDVVSQGMSMRMASCLVCHRDPAGALPPGAKIKKGAEHCYACHR